MRDIASTFRLPSLFRITAVAAVCATLMFLSGCGCKCNRPKCNSCSTCSTCGVSEAAPAAPCASCAACAAANSGSQYDNVGQAPPTISAPAYVQPSTFSPPPATAPANFDRVGQTQDLPVFSPNTPPAATPVVAPIAAPPAPAPAQLLPPTQPRSGGVQYHTLSKGETVYGLSRKYGVAPKTIIAANHFSDPNRLAVGTKIVIPAQ